MTDKRTNGFDASYFRGKLLRPKEFCADQHGPRPALSTCWLWVSQGHIEAVKVGGMTCLVGDSIADFLEAAPRIRARAKDAEGAEARAEAEAEDEDEAQAAVA